jgi:hypothetical protein
VTLIVQLLECLAAESFIIILVPNNARLTKRLSIIMPTNEGVDGFPLPIHKIEISFLQINQSKVKQWEKSSATNCFISSAVHIFHIQSGSQS